jgi:hypothetical protein
MVDQLVNKFLVFQFQFIPVESHNFSKTAPSLTPGLNILYCMKPEGSLRSSLDPTNGP